MRRAFGSLVLVGAILLVGGAPDKVSASGRGSTSYGCRINPKNSVCHAQPKADVTTAGVASVQGVGGGQIDQLPSTGGVDNQDSELTVVGGLFLFLAGALLCCRRNLGYVRPVHNSFKRRMPPTH